MVLAELKGWFVAVVGVVAVLLVPYAYVLGDECAVRDSSCLSRVLLVGVGLCGLKFSVNEQNCSEWVDMGV